MPASQEAGQLPRLLGGGGSIRGWLPRCRVRVSLLMWSPDGYAKWTLGWYTSFLPSRTPRSNNSRDTCTVFVPLLCPLSTSCRLVLIKLL